LSKILLDPAGFPFRDWIMKHAVHLFSSSDIQELYPISEAVRVIEKAFLHHALGKSRMPSKIYLDLPEYGGDFRAMPAALFSPPVAGIKWVNSHPSNRKRGIPTVMAMVIVNDAKTALPLAIMDGTLLTNLRTGAAGAVAVKHLSRRKAKRLALIGAGAQALFQTRAILSVRDSIDEIRIYDPLQKSIRSFEASLAETYTKAIRVAKTARQCVEGADIVVTTTPSRKPIVKREWLADGVHINAIGADAPGKQELDPEILNHATVIVDDRDQATHSGEINIPVNRGQFSPKKIASTLGEVIAKKSGKSLETRTTVFDSTGLAIQDIASAAYILAKAKKRGDLATFDFFS